jgi:hypothetical protein
MSLEQTHACHTGRKAPARRVVGPRVRQGVPVARPTRSVPRKSKHITNTSDNKHQPPATTHHTISTITPHPVQHPKHTPHHPHAMPATPPPTSLRCLTTRTRSWGRVVKHRPTQPRFPGGWPKTAQSSHIHSLGPGHKLSPTCRTPRHIHDTHATPRHAVTPTSHVQLPQYDRRADDIHAMTNVIRASMTGALRGARRQRILFGALPNTGSPTGRPSSP